RSKIWMSRDVLVQRSEPRDPAVSDEMEFVRNPIRDPLERGECEPRLLDLPVDSNLDDEGRLRRITGDRPEPVFESEVDDVHRDSRPKHPLDDFAGPLAVDDDSFAKMTEPAELLEVQVPDPKTIVLGQQGGEQVVDRDYQGATWSERRVPGCGRIVEHIDVPWVRAFVQRHDLDAQIAKFATQVVDVFRISGISLAVIVEMVCKQT